MNFTKEEQALLIKNVKTVLKFVRTNVCPYLRSRYYLKFEDDPGHYPIMFIVDPGKKGSIEFTRGHNSIQYFLGDEYDNNRTRLERYQSGRRYNFWECFDEMFAFLQSWTDLKADLLKAVDKGKNIKNTLKSFTV